jgi:predicted RNase H-like HicB family nuclease
MKSYKVTYERDEDRWWVASIESLPGCHTQGRTIDQARRRIREALSAYLDDDKTAARARLIDDIRLPAGARRALDRALDERRRAEEEAGKAQSTTAAVARLLVEKLGLSMRDAGELLGVSFQRIHQLSHRNG